MAQYIVHPAEAGASAADRYGLAELQGLSEQTSNFVNNAALQLRQLQEQKSRADVMRNMVRAGMNPMTGGKYEGTALGRTSRFLSEPRQDLSLAQMSLMGRTLTGDQILPGRLGLYAPMASWPGVSAGSRTPFGGGAGDAMPTTEQIQSWMFGIPYNQ